MKKINFGARDTNLDNIKVAMRLYPYPANTTQLIRLALAAYIRNADPVQLEQARKQAQRNKNAADCRQRHGQSR